MTLTYRRSDSYLRGARGLLLAATAGALLASCAHRDDHTFATTADREVLEVERDAEETENVVAAREYVHEDATDAGLNEDQYDADMAAMCPMDAQDVTVQAQSGPNGVALIFIIEGGEESKAELRKRVRTMADFHNRITARDDNTVVAGYPGATSWETPGLASSSAFTKDTSDGAMLVFIPDPEVDPALAERGAEQQADWMNTGNCPPGLQKQARRKK